MAEPTLSELATETWTIAENTYYAEKLRGQLKKCAAALRGADEEKARLTRLSESRLNALLDKDKEIARLQSELAEPAKRHGGFAMAEPTRLGIEERLRGFPVDILGPFDCETIRAARKVLLAADEEIAWLKAPKLRLCHVCAHPTELACSDCQINLHATVYVCSNHECRDEHDRKCSATAEQAEAALAEKTREIDEALMLTESCSTLKEMASACIEGAMWQNEATKAQDALAEMRQAAAAFEADLSPDCDGPERDALRAALARHLSATEGK